jgi:beta-lactamase regulating signal transducer with metallopeptidase domain
MTALQDLLGQPLVHRLGWTLLHFLWQGAAVALLLAGVLFLLRRRSASARYLAACTGLALMALLPVLTFARVNVPSAAPPVAEKAGEVATTPAPDAARDVRDVVVAAQPLRPMEIPAAAEAPVTPAAVPEEKPAWSLETLQPFLPWVVGAWLAGMLLLSVRLCGGWVLLQRLRRRHTRAVSGAWHDRFARLCQRLHLGRPVRLLESGLLGVPAVLGWLRPVILVPASALAGLPAAQLEAILAHELAHIRRHDYLVNLLQSVVETLLFYHPAVWWVSRRIRLERENCCDDMAVQVCGDRLVYARALAAVEELRAPVLGAAPPLAPAANGTPLLDRVRRLLGVSAPPAHRFAGWLAGAAALATVVAVGASLALRPAVSEAEEKKDPGKEKKDQDKGKKGRDLMTVTGKVLGFNGKPVAAADVAVLGWPKGSARTTWGQTASEVLGQGKTDAKGNYRLRVVRTSRKHFWNTSVVARAAGRALGQHTAADAKNPGGLVVLDEEQILRGRLFDLQGRPAAKVRVVATRVFGPQFMRPYFQVKFQEPPHQLRAWLAPMTTDDQGRFTLRGLGAGWTVSLTVLDDRFARQRLLVNPQAHELQYLKQYRRGGNTQPFVEVKPNKAKKEDFTWSLMPARLLEGTVTYADTRQVAAGARLVVYTGQQVYSLVPADRVTGQTDTRGRFRIVPGVGNYYIFVVYPPAGQPYFLQSRLLRVTQGGVAKKKVDFALPRGVLVRGTVTDQATGKPVAGANVEFVPREVGNKFFSREVRVPADELKPIAASDQRGQFRLVALPGPGHLLVLGPTLDYLRVPTSQRALTAGKPGGFRYYPNALVKLDLKPGTKSHEVKVTLRRGVTVKGKLVGPGGKPVLSASLYARSYIPVGYSHQNVQPLLVGKDTFELPGCDPDRAETVYVLDQTGRWGAMTRLPAKEAKGKPVTVRLQACTSAVVRFVDEKGKVVPDCRPMPELLITPGGDYNETFLGTKLGADAIGSTRLHPWYYNPRPDGKGRFTMPGLIPGATFRLLAYTPRRGIFNLNKTFTVEAGKTLDLKDIVIKNPN